MRCDIWLPQGAFVVAVSVVEKTSLAKAGLLLPAIGHDQQVSRVEGVVSVVRFEALIHSRRDWLRCCLVNENGNAGERLRANPGFRSQVLGSQIDLLEERMNPTVRSHGEQDQSQRLSSPSCWYE